MTVQTVGKQLVWFAVILLLSVGITPARAQSLPDFTGLVTQVRPSVVNISTVGKAVESDLGIPDGKNAPELPDSPETLPYDELLRRFFGDRDGEVPRFNRDSLGSGFIISADGYILTNEHVVRDADRIVVRLSDRREFDGKVIGTDKRSDIALLKINADKLPVAKIGDSTKLKVGEWVLAIGSPFGFEHSVTAGIVSATGRTLPNENYVPFIQTDVAINPGNSGGPLFNLDGQVIGVNSQIFSRTGGYMGLSFAIPSNMAMEVVEQLKTQGRVSRGWLGVYIQDITRELGESFGMQKPEGALVARVLQGSPAEKGGLQVGDVIVAFDGKPVERSTSLPPIVGRTPVDKKVQVQIIREGKPKTLMVKLAELPDEDKVEVAREEPAEGDSYNKRLGIVVVVPTQEQRDALELGEYGLLVQKVGPGPAREAGIQQGDALVMVNGVKVEDLAGFNEVVKGLKAGQTVPVLVHRQDGPLFLPLKLAAQ
jgi:serine protease Do